MSYLMNDDETGHVAVFDEAPGGGDPGSPAALCNRPLRDPLNWLTHLSYHSAFNLLELLSDTEVTINHPAVAGATAAGGETDISAAFTYNGGILTWEVLTHDIGDYEPLVFVTAGSNALSSTFLIQANAGGAQRYVSASSTTTKVLIKEVMVKGNTTLAALTQTYRILVFRNPRAPEGDLAIEIDPPEDVVRLGRGRFDLSRRYMVARDGGTPFGLATGPTIDLKNGAPRFVNPDGSIVDPIPATLRLAIRVTSQPAVYGDPMNYTGSYTGTPAIQLQVP